MEINTAMMEHSLIIEKKAVNKMITHRNLHIATGLVVSVAFLAGMTFSNVASAEELSPASTGSSQTAAQAIGGCQTINVNLTGEQQETVNKIVAVGKHFHIQSNKLSVDLTKQQLKSQYGFTDSQYEFLQQQVLGVANGEAESHQTANKDFQYDSLLARCGGVYLNNSDLTVGFATALVAAAEAGPEALAAAFTAIASMIGGPIGTIIAGGIGLLGIGFFIDLAAKLIGAVAQGKGVCFTTQWGFPPLKTQIM